MRDGNNTDMPVCRRCLLDELPEDGLYRNMREIIDSLPGEVKAPSDLYERRLTVCKECDRLVNGMCVLCGCFVEVRAAKLAQKCPEAARKW